MSPGLRVFSPGRLPLGLAALISALLLEVTPASGAVTPAPVVAFAPGEVVPWSVPWLCGAVVPALEFMSTFACAKAMVLANAKAPASSAVFIVFIRPPLSFLVTDTHADEPQLRRIGTEEPSPARVRGQRSASYSVPEMKPLRFSGAAG